MVLYYDFNDLKKQMDEAGCAILPEPKHQSVVQGRTRSIDVTANSSRSIFLFDKPVVVCNREGFAIKAQKLIENGFNINIVTMSGVLRSTGDVENYLKSSSQP